MSKIVEDMKNEVAYKTEKAIAERIIRDGSMSLDKIMSFLPSLSMDDLKKLEAEIMQPV